MKKLLLSCVLLLIMSFAFAQVKPKQKEKPPTQKELGEMMKEAQKELDNMSPEDKKMMDSLGIKMPSLKNVPKVTDKQLAEAWEKETAIVPKKDAARIASISKIPVTNTSMPAFLSAAHSKVITQLKTASKSKGEEIYRLIKTQYNSVVATGNAAATLWMIGKAELALYVMGKACIDGPANTDNLNNYASMLSMGGAEQLAIPLFHNLNKRFPKNSTVLNNIGQAWFGLGDIDKAEKYIDSTIRIYAYHPQANFTKSFIEESKGHKEAAVEAMKKSIKHAYTKDKEDRLRKLGHKLESKDISWPFKPKPDPLGLEKFNHPDFPKSVDESIALEKDWIRFRNECASAIQDLEIELTQAEDAAAKAQEKRTNEYIDYARNAFNTGKVSGELTVMPFFATKAFLKLAETASDKDGSYNYKIKKVMADMNEYRIKSIPLKENYGKAIEKLSEEDLEQTGEGLPNLDFCPRYKAVADAYLSAYNPGLQKLADEYLDITRRKKNEETDLYQYICWPEQFEVFKLTTKIDWLKQLKYLDFESITKYKCNPAPYTKKGDELSEFDDVHCEYHSELKLMMTTIRTDCSRMTTEIDLKFLKLGLKEDLNKETFGDQFMGCTVEVGAGAGAGANLGPIKVEASVGAGVGVEFDRGGLKDIVVKVSGGVSAGTDIIEGGGIAGVGVSDLSVDVGAKGQISIISGTSSVESTGLLEGVFKK